MKGGNGTRNLLKIQSNPARERGAGLAPGATR